MIGSCPVALTYFMKSSGFIPVVASLLMGWKYTVWWLSSTKLASNKNVTSCFVSLNNDRGVTHPCPTPSFSNMTSSSANRNPPLAPTFLARSLKLTSRVAKAVKSHSRFFFLSLRKRFLLCAPGRWPTYGIMASTVNTAGCSIVSEVIPKFSRYSISSFRPPDILEMFLKTHTNITKKPVYGEQFRLVLCVKYRLAYHIPSDRWNSNKSDKDRKKGDYKYWLKHDYSITRTSHPQWWQALKTLQRLFQATLFYETRRSAYLSSSTGHFM